MSEDRYVYYNCVSGNCPLLVEERLFGTQVSTCKEYCGEDNYNGCNDCYFCGSDICNDCIHKEDCKHE